MCASDGYSYERADIEMYVTKKKKDNQPIVSPMDADTVSVAPLSLSLYLSLSHSCSLSLSLSRARARARSRSLRLPLFLQPLRGMGGVWAWGSLKRQRLTDLPTSSRT